MSKESPEVDIVYDELVTETEKAKLFMIEEEEVWLPKSIISRMDEEEQTVTIPEWLARKRGLNY